LRRTLVQLNRFAAFFGAVKLQQNAIAAIYGIVFCK
jgi:hypothetical protein